MQRTATKGLVMKEIWVDEMTHTLPMVCFGDKKDHMVFSPLRAKEIGESLIQASSMAYDLIQGRVDEALLAKERAADADQG